MNYQIVICIIREVQWDAMASVQEYKRWKMSVNVSRKKYFKDVISRGRNSQKQLK